MAGYLCEKFTSFVFIKVRYYSTSFNDDYDDIYSTLGYTNRSTVLVVVYLHTLLTYFTF